VDVIDAYVAALGGALRGPRPAKADLVTEVRDSLADAAAAHERGGLGREAAERRAVEEFGALGEIAPGYQTELGLTQGRRTALLVLFVLGAQPVVWGLAGPRVAKLTAQPWVSHPGPGYVLVEQGVEWLGVVAMLSALLAALACGIGTRYLGVGTRLTRVTGVFALAVSVVFALLGSFLGLLSAEARSLLNIPGVLWTLAFLLIPLGWVALSARRCLTAT
jgi:hypothetical protein